MQSARWSRQTALRRLLWYLCVAYSVSFSFSNTIFSSISGSVNKKKNYKQLSALCVMQLHIFFIPKSLTLIFLTRENQEQQVADSSTYISVYKQSCWCNMFTFISDKHRADLIPPPGGVYANTCLGFSQWRWREETPAPQVLEQVDQLFHSPQLPFMDSGRSPISTHCSWKHH